MKSITTKFISHFVNTKTYLFIGNDFWEKESKMFLRNNEKEDFIGLFDFSGFKKKYFNNFIEYFQKKDSKKYNVIISDLPFGLKNIKNTDFDYPIPENWEFIYKLLQNIESDGVLLVGVEPSFGTSIKSKQFLEFLQNKNFFLSSLIETPQNILTPLASVQPNISIFTKQNNNGKMFISSLDESDNEKIIFNNYISKTKNGNLSEGDMVETKDFKGFYNYRIKDEIIQLKTQYKDFNEVSIKDIALEINTTTTLFIEEKKSSYLYISKVGNLNVFILNISSAKNNPTETLT